MTTEHPFDDPPDPTPAPMPPPTTPPHGPSGRSSGGSASAGFARLAVVGAAVAALGVGSVIALTTDLSDELADGDQSPDSGVIPADDTASGAVDAQPIATSEPALFVMLADGRSLDGTGNNVGAPTLGAADQPYARDTDPSYSDGISGVAADRPDERYLSNRVFNGNNQNLFSENGVTHWGFVWGQFIDHTIGLAAGADDTEEIALAFDASDPLEDFTNDLGMIGTSRSVAADGTGAGTDTPATPVNVVSSYIDAWNVYGGTDERLDWLREGVVDGDPANNSATLVTADGYLPTVLARVDAEAPDMDLMGRLFANPTDAIVAGDTRANENIGLTAVHTLFVREHNRIVESLPDTLDENTKFAIARRVVGALEQYITYEEFLPAMGVALDDYTGYDPTVDPSITNEFATVGYRAHSQIHGEFEAEIPGDEVTDELIASLTRQGVEVEPADDGSGSIEVAVPLNVAYGNPGLLVEIGLGNLAAGLSSEAAYANDEQIDNQLRSVLFQIPGPTTQNPLDCLDGTDIASCFSSVNDLGALDVFRTYDHGVASYNDLREEYGLARIGSFAELTGEDTDEFPAGLTIDDPEIMEIVGLFDAAGVPVSLDIETAIAEGRFPVEAVRRSTLAARLAAIFGSVDDVDGFTGMVSEPHVAGTEFGELQLAMWTRQFEALRDGDRYFYANDPALEMIAELYGIDFRRPLADVIVDNTSAERGDLPQSAFVLDATSSETSDTAADRLGDADGDADDDEVIASPADRDDERNGDDGDRRRRDRRPERARPPRGSRG